MDASEFWVRVQEWVMTSGLRVLLIVGLAAIGWIASRFLSKRVSFLLTWRHGEDAELKKRAQTIAAFFRYTLLFAILVAGSIMVLKEIGIEVGPILAGAGVVGLAVGFGAQNLVQDIISGFFILLEDQIRVGDVVSIKGKGGLVERIGLRMITLRDLDGSVHYVRNGQIDVVTNMTKDFSHCVIDIQVGYRESVAEVMGIMREIDEELRAEAPFKEMILQPLEVFGIEKFAESGMVIRARAKTRPIQQWAVGREFNLRLKKKLDERGIEMPYPYMTVTLAQNKSGEPQKIPVLVSAADGVPKDHSPEQRAERSTSPAVRTAEVAPARG